ncbi:MAG: hypothetical protein EOO20_05695 [Chryseobacterium sp.]|nr:MAG: hypothetical protein EOO20_05695 [Chryseobacterium sp.]
MRNSIITIFALCLIASQCFGQTTKNRDSVQFARLTEAAIKNSILRQGAFSTEIVGSTTIDAKSNDNTLFKGKISMTRYRANFNLPMFQFGKNTIALSFAYLQQQIKINEVESFNPQLQVGDMTIDRKTITGTLSLVRVDSLFSKPVIYTANISALSSKRSIQQVNFLGSVTFVMKRTPTTSLSLGAIIILDPSSPLPIVPQIYYSHQFKPGGWQFIVDLPRRALVRKTLSLKSSASFGTELSRTNAFLDVENQFMPKVANYSTLELRTGPTYEYRISKKVMLTLNGGLFTPLSSGLKDKGSSKSFLTNTNGMSPYVDFSISILPFLKSIIK